MLRSVNTLRQAIDSIRLVLPENYPELTSLRYSLAGKIEKLFEVKGSAIPPKIKQSLTKEKNELLSKWESGRLIAHGHGALSNSGQKRTL